MKDDGIRGNIDDFFNPVKQDAVLMTKSVMSLDWETARFLYLTLHHTVKHFEHTTDIYIDHLPIEEYTNDDLVQKHVNEGCCEDMKGIMQKMEAVFPSLKELNNDC